MQVGSTAGRKGPQGHREGVLMVIIHVDGQRATAAGDTARGISHRQVRCCLGSAGRSQAHRPPQPALAQRPECPPSPLTVCAQPCPQGPPRALEVAGPAGLFPDHLEGRDACGQSVRRSRKGPGGRVGPLTSEPWNLRIRHKNAGSNEERRPQGERASCTRPRRLRGQAEAACADSRAGSF